MIKRDYVRFMSDGTNIEYSKSGSGRNLLLLHGSRGFDGELESLTEALGRYCTVFCPDRRGWMNSGAKGKEYSMDQECSDAAEFMEAENIELIFGAEYGALIALHMAVRYPVKKIILMEPYLAAPGNLRWLPGFKRALDKEKYSEAMAIYARKTVFEAGFVPRIFLKSHFRDISFHTDRSRLNLMRKAGYDGSGASPGFREAAESDEWRRSKRMLRQAAAELEAAKASWPELGQLASSKTEALLISVRDDSPRICQGGERIGNLLPRWQRILVDYSGQEEKGEKERRASSPAELIACITKFLTEGGE